MATSTNFDWANPSRELSRVGYRLIAELAFGLAIVCPAMAATQWQPLTLEWTGPTGLTELDSAENPFLDYRLAVSFTNNANGTAYQVPGYYAGNDAGGQSLWRAHFTPDQAGSWSYDVDFRNAPGVAVLLDPEIDGVAHPTTAFHGNTGSVSVAPTDPNAPGFMSAGRLAYNGTHYLQTLGEGKAFIKTGSSSPENLLGYAGFDNTQSSGSFIHRYADHVQDWNPGDPTFTTDNPNGQDPGALDGMGLIGALNYLGNQGVNSVYFMTFNVGGDGRDTHPYADPDYVNSGGAGNNQFRLDNSKLAQWLVVLEHAQREGIHLNMVLNETEGKNRLEHDDATLGVERKLYYREMIARFGHLNALQWNITEEYNRTRGSATELSPDTVKEFAAYISALDAYDHPLSVHNGNYSDWPNGTAHPDQHTNQFATGQFNEMAPFFDHPDFDLTSYQRYSQNDLSDEIEFLRDHTASLGRPIPIMLDETRSITSVNTNPSEHNNNPADAVRRRLLYDVLFSGGGVDWFVRPEDTSLEDFRPYEQVYREARIAREFMEDHLPFWMMEPDDDLVRGADDNYGGVEAFALLGEAYAFYLPDGSNDDNNLDPNDFPEIDLSDAVGLSFRLSWFNPRTGSFAGNTSTLLGGGWAALGATPDGQGNANDWIGLVSRLTVIPEPATTALLLPALMLVFRAPARR